jgi:hypothetical protein
MLKVDFVRGYFLNNNTESTITLKTAFIIFFGSVQVLYPIQNTYLHNNKICMKHVPFQLFIQAGKVSEEKLTKGKHCEDKKAHSIDTRNYFFTLFGESNVNSCSLLS